MAVVDSNGKFMNIDVGAQGRIGDAGVYSNCSLSRALENETLAIPKSDNLPGTDLCCPYMLVGDEAFPLRTFLMKPFHRRGMADEEIVFNYRLSRARRIVENAFGMLANRFRIYRAPIVLRPCAAKEVVLATTVLHNFLADRKAAAIEDDSDDENATCGDDNVSDDDDDDVQTDGLRSTRIENFGRPMTDAKELRDKLAHYFMGRGRIKKQDNKLNLPQAL
jgi:DDE superfamily endonuclease